MRPVYYIQASFSIYKFIFGPDSNEITEDMVLRNIRLRGR